MDGGTTDVLCNYIVQVHDQLCCWNGDKEKINIIIILHHI